MESELRRTLDALPGLVWTALADGRVEFVNRRWYEYTGLSGEQASGECWLTAFHPDDRPALLEAWRVTIASGEPGEAEARMRRFDGVYRWFLCRASPIVNAAGEVVNWCGINTDIEERKQAEEALRLDEQRYRRIVDSMPTRVVLFTPEGEVFHANRHTLDYAGATLEEVKAWKSNGMLHPDDLDAIVSQMQASLRTGQPYEAESRHRRADGVYRWFHVQGFPLRDSSGRIVLWHFLQTDIDDRKRAEALLAAEKRLLEMIVTGQPLPAVLDDLCRQVEAISDDCLCNISLISPDDVTFQQGAPQHPELSNIVPADGCPVAATPGPCGLVAITKLPCIVPDVASEARFAQPWRERHLAEGLRACWAAPILSCAGETLGTFAIFRSEPGHPNSFQRDLIEQLTHVASLAIEHARSNLALKRSEESFRAIVETTPECVKVVARDGTLLRVNSAGVAIAGAPSEHALLGRNFYDFVAPEHRNRYVEFSHGVCSDEKDFLEFDIINMHGERMHMETHAAPMRWTDGTVVQLCVTRDITARKRAEEQLRRSAALMANVEKLSLSGSFSWRPANGEITWSEQLYRIYGIEPGVPITTDMIAARVHPGDLHLLHAMLEHAQEGKDLDCDHRLLMPDGTVKYLLIQAHATRDPQGRLEYNGAAQDVTERRQSEEALGSLRAELAHACRVNSLGALTASIAHEINQPLAGIMTNASTGVRMLSAEPPNVDGALDTVRRTLRDGRRASDILTRLRALFRKEAVTTDAIDLVEAAHEVVDMLHSETRTRRILLRLKAATDLPPVTGDRVQLQQVVLNLLLNAMEAMDGVDDRPRQMLLSIERDDGESLRLAVTDSGVGFAPEHAGKLFDAFYTTKGGGMGLGLSVSRSIIERHGGHLWATPNESVGATFSFSLPCRPDITAAAATAQSARAEDEQCARAL